LAEAPKLFDNHHPGRYIAPVEMNATFAKQITMHLPVNGCLTRWQRKSRPSGIVGMKA
jgi:hypothetical protein